MYCENTLQVDVDITRLFEGSKWFRYEDGHPHSNSPISKMYTNSQQTIPQTSLYCLMNQNVTMSVRCLCIVKY